MKIYISLLLTLALIFSLVGPTQTVSATTIKLNKTDQILYVGDSTTLKVSGTSKSVNGLVKIVQLPQCPVKEK